MSSIPDDINKMLPEHLREDRRLIVHFIVYMYFMLDGSLDQDPPVTDDDDRSRELRQWFGDYISDEKDADIKEEALMKMFELSISEHPYPEKLTAEDIEFLERIKNMDLQQRKRDKNSIH